MPPTKAKDSVLAMLPKLAQEEKMCKEGGTLICRAYSTVVTMTKFLIEQYIKTSKHQKNKKLKTQQQTIGTVQDMFSTDLCQAFLAADIPLYKLNNVVLRAFLEKYCGRVLPSESLLRNKFVDDAYDSTIDKIREEIGDGPVWISIDETTDVDSRYIANIIVGRLDAEKPSRPFLLNSIVMDKTNHKTIGTAINSSMNLLWPNGVRYENVLLLITDAAAYMKKAGESLQSIYPRMLHVTCLAHALHRLTEEIRFLNPVTNEIIGTVKRVFLKAPSRILLFQEIATNVPLPPKPVLTRWGTWLSAAIYYADHYNEVKEVILKLENDSAAVDAAKKLFSENEAELKSELCALKMHYAFIADSITQLEKNTSSLESILDVVNEVKKIIKKVPNKKVKDKLNNVLSKNPALTALQAVAKCDFAGLRDVDQYSELNPAEMAALKYAPVVSAEVERSFSMYKSILRDNRRSFTFENLKKT